MFSISRRSTLASACALLAVLGLTATAEDKVLVDPGDVPGVLVGQSTGVLAVHYNQSTNDGMDLSNIAYMRLQFSESNTNGAFFQFDNSPQDFLGGLSFNDVLSGSSIENSPFGLDLVQIAPTWDGVEPIPQVMHYTNVDGTLANRQEEVAGPNSLFDPVAWSLSNYKVTGSGPETGTPLNTKFRSAPNATFGGITNANFTTGIGGVPTNVQIEGVLQSDGKVYWFTPGTPSIDLSAFNIEPSINLQGTLTRIGSGTMVDYFLGSIVYFIADEVPCTTELDESQVVSPTGSAATGVAGYLPGAGTVRLTVVHDVASPTGAEIRSGMPGETGSLVRDLGSGANPIVVDLTAQEYNSFATDPHYIVITSNSFPNGEIRGNFEGCDPVEASPGGEGEGEITPDPDEPVEIGDAAAVLAVHFNPDTGMGVDPANISYVRLQFSPTNTNGAYFQYSDEEIAPNLFPGRSFNSELSGRPVGDSPFGLELIQVAPTWSGTSPVPQMNHYENTDNTLAGRDIMPVGPHGFLDPIAWGTHFYSRTGDSAADGTPLNTAFRSKANAVGTGFDMNRLVTALQANMDRLPLYGTVLSDGVLYPTSPSNPQVNLAFFGVDPLVQFQGTVNKLFTVNDGQNIVSYYHGGFTFATELPDPQDIFGEGEGAIIPPLEGEMEGEFLPGEGEVEGEAPDGGPEGLPVAKSNGVLAVHYNQDTGLGKQPDNIAYWRMHFSPANLNGTPFQFDGTPQATLADNSFNDIFSGRPVGQSQFGLELVQIAATWDGNETIPSVEHYENTDNSLSGRQDIPAGPNGPDDPVAWSVVDYKITGSNGPADGTALHSILRGASGAPDTGVTRFSLASKKGANAIASNISVNGKLRTDGFIHWFNPNTNPTDITVTGLEPEIRFEGDLTHLTGSENVDYFVGSVDYFLGQSAPCEIELDGSQVVPASGSTNTGSASFLALDEQVQLTVLHDVPSPTAAEIRAGGPGETGDVVVDLGSLADDLNNPIVVTLSLQQYNAIVSAPHYIVIRSTSFPNGDIRGQIEGCQPADIVPDEFHSADQNTDNAIDLSELIRVIQIVNSNAYHCDGTTEDGYDIGTGDQNCTPHAADAAPQDWVIDLSELLRVIQIHNLGSYTFCPDAGTEDGFCAVVK